MIKGLIKDIAYDKITLTQALTRAKLIGYKIKNEEFKLWLSQELSGYKYAKGIPDYRILETETVADVFNPFIRSYEMKIEISSSIKEEIGEDLYRWYFTNGISSLERTINKTKGNFCYMLLGSEATEFIRQYLSLPRDTRLNHLMKKVAVSLLFTILANTKQRLLDILMELDNEFPNLENEYGTMEDDFKAKQIINNTIHGNVSNTNFGLGETVNQEQTIHQSQLNGILEELSTLGVESKDLQELETIVSKSDEKSLSKKLIAWAGRISQKSIEKGVELQIPIILEKINSLL